MEISLKKEVATEIYNSCRRESTTMALPATDTVTTLQLRPDRLQTVLTAIDVYIMNATVASTTPFPPSYPNTVQYRFPPSVPIMAGDQVGTLQVDIDTPNVPSGGEVTGFVHLLVTQSTHAQSLDLFFKGKECARWTASCGTGKKQVMRLHTGLHKFMCLQVSVYSFMDGDLPAGQYSFPFALRIPCNLPSSFYFGDGCCARLSYVLVARLGGCGANVGRGKVGLNVTELRYMQIVPMSPTTEPHIFTCCCCDKRVIKVRVDLDKSVYQPGETITVTLSVDNSQSLLVGTAYTVSLIRTIILRDTERSSHIVSVVIASNTVSTDPLETGQPTSVPTVFQFTASTDESTLHLCSVAACLIDCVYTVKGELSMSGCCTCCGEAPVAEKEVVISPANSQKQPLPVMAEMWKPVVMTKLGGLLGLAGKKAEDGS